MMKSDIVSLTGNDSYSEIYPVLRESADRDSFERWLDSWCRACPGTHWLSYLESRNEMAESFEQIKMLCWVLIIFIGMIGVLNIINTVYSNIHTRINEIRHAAGHWDERRKPVQNISVGGRLLWDFCIIDRCGAGLYPAFLSMRLRQTLYSSFLSLLRRSRKRRPFPCWPVCWQRRFHCGKSQR